MITFLVCWLVCQSMSVLLVWWYTWQLGSSSQLHKAPPVVIVVAIKGHTVEFDEFVKILLAQDYPDYRVIFSVEANSDPVVAAIEKWRAADPERVDLIVAGLSIDEGQKVANLRAALAVTV